MINAKVIKMLWINTDRHTLFKGNKQEINKTMGKNAQREYENSPSL